MTKQWIIAPPAPAVFSEKTYGQNRVIAQLLHNRGFKKAEDVKEFFQPDYSIHSYDPFLFCQMEQAVEEIIKHIKNRDKIIIYGDYDADGVTAAALLYEIFFQLKAQVEVYIPDRITEGYGINKKSLDNIKERGGKLIITVDNGIRNKSEIEYAIELGISIIVTDHHTPPEGEDCLPVCLIINPRVNTEKYPYKNLAGVGVAFKLAEALIKKARLSDDIKNELSRRLLDFVAVGTIADCVELTGENRVLAKLGLSILNERRRLGFNELINIARITDQISSWHVGWLIAPRINAAGRLEHAGLALEILTTKDNQTAKKLSLKLQEKNSDRQKITEDIVADIEKQIAGQNNSAETKIIIAVSPYVYDSANTAWNEGVVGLAASRLSDKYYLPCLVITGGEEGIKGSGRSVEEFHITKALEKCSLFLNRFGGHSAACGFTLKDRESLNFFISAIRQIADEDLAGIDLSPKLRIESEVTFEEASMELAGEIINFEPFGEGNNRPILATRNATIIDKNCLGQDGQHIKFKLKAGKSKIVNAIGFGLTKRWSHLKTGDLIDIAYHLDINQYNGNKEVQLKIVDIIQGNS